jgi:hypothetical protein
VNNEKSSPALIVAAAASRIEEETRTLAKLTAKLRGLCFVEPEELDRLRAVERAARAVVDRSVGHYMNAEDLFCLTEALAPEWTLERLQLPDEGPKNA